METYNIVGQYNIGYNINIMYLYRLLVAEANNPSIKDFVIDRIKFKNNTWGDVKNPKTFKNALHLELKEPKISTKIFPKGIIHMSGIKNEKILEFLIVCLKKVMNTEVEWTEVNTDTNLPLLYSKKLNTYAYSNNETVVVFRTDSKKWLYSDTETIIECWKEDNSIRVGNHIKKQKIVAKDGFLDIKIVLYENRKNIPPKDKFYIDNNLIHYKSVTKHKIIGERQLPDLDLWRKHEAKKDTKYIFKCISDSTEPEMFDIHNINKGFSIPIVTTMGDIKEKLKILDIDYVISKQKVETIILQFFYSKEDDTIFSYEKEDCLPIKIQIYLDNKSTVKIRFTTKVSTLDPAEYIKSVLETPIEKKEVKKDTRDCTLMELYEYIQ